MILAVCGGKGGVGKSTVAAALGDELDAVVVDTDAATPAAGTGPDLHDVLTGRAEPEAAVVEADGVAVVPCDGRLAGARAVDLGALGTALDRLERRYGVVIVDCPPGLATDVGYQLYCAHAAVVVTTPERAALSAAFRTRELAGDVETPVVAAVLNAAGSDAEGIARRLERRVGAPAVVIRERAEIERADGRPLQAVAPDSPAVERVRDLAETVETAETGI